MVKRLYISAEMSTFKNIFATVK